MPFFKRSTASKDKVEPINNSMPVGLPVSASTFSHKGPDGHWTKYDAAQSAMIAEAMAETAPRWWLAGRKGVSGVAQQQQPSGERSTNMTARRQPSTNDLSYSGQVKSSYVLS